MNTNIDIKTVLEKWAEFSEWDPDQRKFNLMSYNYFFHKNNEIRHKNLARNPVHAHNEQGQI